MSRLYPLNHAKMNFFFKQSPSDFIVKEQNLYEFSGEGEHLVYYIRKKNLTTWELLSIIAKHCNIKTKEIGYAGLKDKNALTYQYISLHKDHESKIQTLIHPSIKIISQTHHNNKIKMGHLSGNTFFIRFKRVSPLEAKKIKDVLKWIKENGMPNYFGHQRFSSGNIEKAAQLLSGEIKIRDKREKTFLINAYQSDIFNAWLSKRVELSKLLQSFSSKELAQMLPFDKALLQKLQAQTQFFKLLPGELMMHYPHGKVFELDSVQRFIDKDIAPTGPLFGKKMSEPTLEALAYEKQFYKQLPANGARRYAWIFPQIIDSNYKEEQEHFEINLTLPKGCYATVFIEMIINDELTFT
ncbi:MAG: tRNA pseudouridine(13) synthase TruD [Campylobacterota bacterium]